MKKRFSITFEITTPESAEDGDFAEIGFVEPEFGIQIPIGEIEPGAAPLMTLRQALDRLAVPFLEDCGTWFCEMDSRHDFRSGAEERRSLHPPENITGASYARLRRLVASS